MFYRLITYLMQRLAPWQRQCLLEEMVEKKSMQEKLTEALRQISHLDVPSQNACFTDLFEKQIPTQDYLLSAWAVHTTYMDCVRHWLPDKKDLEVLEVGPGDNIMGALLWLARPEVLRYDQIDKFLGRFMKDPILLDCAERLLPLFIHAYREGFANESPYRDFRLDRVKEIIALARGGEPQEIHDNYAYHLMKDFSELPLEANQYDFLFSNASLEHFEDPRSAIAEFFRVLKPGGISAHTIDMRDHRDMNFPLDYLSFDEATWAEKSKSLPYPNNRLRHPDFIRVFEEAGFELLSVERMRSEPDELAKIKVHPSFSHMTLDEIAITRGLYVHRKPER